MLKKISFILCTAGLLLYGCSSRPQTLAQVIQQEQAQYIRPSTGPERYECFTDDELTEFVQKNVTSAIVKRLRGSRDFIKIIQSLKAQPEAERRATLMAARISYQPLWEEIGRISSEGQTRAGQEGQRRICTAIADLAEELLTLPDETLVKMVEK